MNQSLARRSQNNSLSPSLSLSSSSSSSSVPRCSYPGCTRPCYVSAGIVHGYCGRTHASRALEAKGEKLQEPHGFCQECLYPGCNNPIFYDPSNGRVHDFCSYSHAQYTKKDVIAPPHTQDRSKKCGLPGCNKPVYLDFTSGVTHDYCGRTHAVRAREKKMLPPPSDMFEICFRGSGPTIASDWTLSLMKKSHPKYDAIKTQWREQWKKPGKIPIIMRVWQIRNPPAIYERYVKYESYVKYSQGKRELRRLFHGTSSSETCYVGIDQNFAPCALTTCPVCNICTTSFNLSLVGTNTNFLRYGRGLYFSATPGKSNDYAIGSEKEFKGKIYRVMFLCKVVVSNSFVTTETRLDGPPKGYDSVVGQPSKGGLNYDEVVVYHEDAAIPSYLIVYEM